MVLFFILFFGFFFFFQFLVFYCTGIEKKLCCKYFSCISKGEKKRSPSFEACLVFQHSLSSSVLMYLGLTESQIFISGWSNLRLSFLNISELRNPLDEAKLLQSCPTLCDPVYCVARQAPPCMDSPGKSTGVGGRFFSWRSSQPRDQSLVSYVSWTGRQVLYYYHHLGNPRNHVGCK